MGTFLKTFFHRAIMGWTSGYLEKKKKKKKKKKPEKTLADAFDMCVSQRSARDLRTF